MPRDVVRPWSRPLLSGLLLVACGGVPDVGLSPKGEEALGTREAALCSGLSVTQLTLNGISTYQGEMAGNGQWAVSTSANGARLEFYVDGALRSVSEESGTSGTWYFSTAGLACGTHTFEVRAYPMVITSTGSRTTCFESPRSLSQSVTELCPPHASVSCRRISTTTLRCTGSASGGSGSYTPHWQEYWYSYYDQTEYLNPWSQGAWTADYYCTSVSSTATAYDVVRFYFKVVDSNGRTSNVSSSLSYTCKPMY